MYTIFVYVLFNTPMIVRPQRDEEELSHQVGLQTGRVVVDAARPAVLYPGHQV